MKQTLILLTILTLILTAAFAENADTFYFSYGKPEISGNTVTLINPADGTASATAVIPDEFNRFSYYENETIPFYFASGDYSHIFYFSYLEGDDLNTAILNYLKDNGYSEPEAEKLIGSMYTLNVNGIPGKFFTGTQSASKYEPQKNHLYAFFQCQDGLCFHLFEISEKESDFFMMLENILPAAPAAVQSGRMIRITTDSDVFVRTQPDAESEKTGYARSGKKYLLLSISDNGWYEIQLEDGTSGFVSPKLAAPVE